MQWLRENETTLLSTPIYVGVDATVEAAQKCPHDIYEFFTDVDPDRSANPTIRQSLERCTGCIATRIRTVGPVKDIQSLWDDLPGPDKVLAQK